MPGFWDNYVPAERPEGTYTNMTDMVKLGEPLDVIEVISDDSNTYGGETKPRFLLKGKVNGGDTEYLVSVPKGYSRDETLLAIAQYLDENEGGSVSVRFQKAKGSNYVEILPA